MSSITNATVILNGTITPRDRGGTASQRNLGGSAVVVNRVD